MIGDVVFVNLTSDTITLNNDGGPYPIHHFDDPVSEEYEKESKAGQDGLWPTYSYDRGMEITIEGAILADDADDYTAKRNALTSCLRFKPAIRQRRSGVLTVTFDGAVENVTADVTIDDISIPRDGVSPNFSQFRFVFFSFLPYWVGVISGDPYYDG